MIIDIRKLKKKSAKSFQLLFLEPMNRLTRKAILLFTVYLIMSLGLTMVVLKVQANNKEEQSTKQIVPARVTDRL